MVTFWALDMTEIIDSDKLKKKRNPIPIQMSVDLYACLIGLFLTIMDRNLLCGCKGITKSLSSLSSISAYYLIVK